MTKLVLYVIELMVWLTMWASPFYYQMFQFNVLISSTAGILTLASIIDREMVKLEIEMTTITACRSSNTKRLNIGEAIESEQHKSDKSSYIIRTQWMVSSH